MPSASPPAEKPRDAERSRTAILDAAEVLFADRGFGGASLSEIGAAAGLSRATPSYFFGGKEALYTAVLERAFADREDAVRAAMAPVAAWADAPEGPLEAPLRAAIRSYLGFLLDRPAFVRLISWEGLDGGSRMQWTPRASRALNDAFTALRGARGLGPFDPDDAVLLFVALTFAPLAFQSTFLRTLGRDLTHEPTRERHVELATGQLLHLMGADAA
jgi:AcrR family transcriptional regulator